MTDKLRFFMVFRNMIQIEKRKLTDALMHKAHSYKKNMDILLKQLLTFDFRHVNL